MDKVLVATSCRSENARFVDFYRMRDDLELPLGSKCKLYPGFFPDYNINDAVVEAINGGYTHLFIVDDDQMLPLDTVTRLLAHDLDIVAVNLLTRTPPFGPYIFRKVDDYELGKQIELPEDEGPVIPVLSCGTGGMLIKVEVLRRMNAPWFYHDEVIKTYDMYFCKKARELDIKIHVDLSCPSGHLFIAAVWPSKANGKWETVLILANAMRVHIPKASGQGESISIKETFVYGEPV